MTQQCCGLRIVDEYEIRVFECRSQDFRITGVGLLVDPEQAFAQGDTVTLQGVVHALGTLEELAISGNDFPAGVNAQFLHQWHQFGQDLCNPTAHARRIDVNNPCIS